MSGEGGHQVIFVKRAIPGHTGLKMALRGPFVNKYLVSSANSIRSFVNMPRKRKDCPICGKQGLLRLANHLADFHQLSSKDRQAYLMQARTFPLDLQALLKELVLLRQNAPIKKRPIKWYK